ncbi:SRP54-type protein [Lipomyces arxii]|uniref:SRP54-type protein n=1 Tax=Lipomyces arxii TaxID=56418 RepID=UPI0034CF47B5
MIDYFTVFTTGGIVLWQKVYQPVSSTMIDSLMSDIFIEDRPRSGEESSMTKDQYTVKWMTANDLGIIFVAVYQSLLQISFIDDLLSNVKKLFSTLYSDSLQVKDAAELPVCKFDDYFTVRYAELEKQFAGRKPTAVLVSNTNEKLVSDEEDGEEDFGQDTPFRITSSDSLTDGPKLAKSDPKLVHLHKRGGRRGRGAKKPGKDSPASSGTEDLSAKKSGKKLRKWDFDGSARDVSDDEGTLDFSETSNGKSIDGGNGDGANLALEDIDAVKNWGSKSKSGDFILKDLSSEISSILSTPATGSKADSTGAAGSALSSGFSFFRNIIGNSVMSEQDMEKALAGMKDHLMKKNVAPEVAQHLCDVVSKSLIGTKTGSWTSVETTVRSAMQDELRKILTPSTSVDLLHEIQRVKSARPPRPYVISVVGVNGVGKSTNLSKIAYWLLQNDMRILIAACDTFRSGAVEQLRVHSRNLTKLTEREGGKIELYEKGYGKDAAVIARDAISYGNENGYDVILIDTAGRRHNDTRLMSSLEKFAKYANPDKIVMVGEALVGTDSVQQARNFNAAFGSNRNLDFFLISKCDTVGDMIGSMVNMTYSTGIPVLFVGTGQMYTDLRTLSVPWAVNMLMG